MNGAKLQAIYRYGAILSVVGTAIAILAFAIQGPNSFIGLLFGFLGPLGAFFFIGAVFSNSTTYYVLGEELLRGVAWYLMSFLGWAIIITETNALSTTPFTVFALPVLTVLGLTLVMAGIRQATGLDLKIQTDGGQLLLGIGGTIAGGFLVLYLVLSGSLSSLLAPLYVVGTVVGFALWWRYWRPQPTAS